MEFGWSASESALRSRIEQVTTEGLPEGWSRSIQSVGSSSATDASMEFAALLGEADLLVPSWPQEYGGKDATRWEQHILAEVMWQHGEPRGPQYMNVNWIGPAIMRFGTADQKDKYLSPMARGAVVWCQGFSEPDAGSDLAALRTVAVRDGDEYVINGEKIWTSYADAAAHCFLLARTDQDASRTAGISVLLVPMDSPGLEVRKIPAIIGDHAFHSLVFTDVRVPTDVLLGTENDGWTIVREALANERVGLPRYVRASQVLDAAAAWVSERGLLADSWIATKLGEARSICEAARVLVYRAVDELSKGNASSGQANVARVSVVDAERAVADVVSEIMGPAGLEEGTLADAQFRNSLAVGIAGGTYEVQLNLIATNLLQLPKN